MVDTGSEYTWLPEELLQGAEVTVTKKDIAFVMANGATITRHRLRVPAQRRFRNRRRGRVRAAGRSTPARCPHPGRVRRAGRLSRQAPSGGRTAAGRVVRQRSNLRDRRKVRAVRRGQRLSPRWPALSEPAGGEPHRERVPPGRVPPVCRNVERWPPATYPAPRRGSWPWLPRSFSSCPLGVLRRSILVPSGGDSLHLQHGTYSRVGRGLSTSLEVVDDVGDHFTQLLVDLHRVIAMDLIPHSFTIERVLQWVASRGSDSKVLTTTRSASSSPILRGDPGRGSSSTPSQPSSRNRRRHLPTVARVVPSSSATSRVTLPGRGLQDDPRPQGKRLRSLRSPCPASQFLQLFIRRLWNLSGMMVRHFRTLPGTDEGYHTPIYWSSIYDTVH